jgi:hypothetical protein
MDHQELLSILQNDIDDLILYPNGIEDGVHYDDDVDDDEEDIKKLEEEFNKKLKQSPVIRADWAVGVENAGKEEVVDDGEEIEVWNELMESAKNVDLQFEDVRANVNSCTTEFSIGPNSSGSPLVFEARIGTVTTVSSLGEEGTVSVSVDHTSAAPEEIDVEIKELMNEMLEAVERIAPLTAPAVLSSIDNETASEKTKLPTEFSEEAYDADQLGLLQLFTQAEHQNQLLYDNLREQDAQKAAEARRLIELEEQRLAEIEREAQAQLERELAVKEQRKLRREEEMRKAHEPKRKNKAAVCICSANEMFVTILEFVDTHTKHCSPEISPHALHQIISREKIGR